MPHPTQVISDTTDYRVNILYIIYKQSSNSNNVKSNTKKVN